MYLCFKKAKLYLKYTIYYKCKEYFWIYASKRVWFDVVCGCFSLKWECVSAVVLYLQWIWRQWECVVILSVQQVQFLQPPLHLFFNIHINPEGEMTSSAKNEITYWQNHNQAVKSSFQAACLRPLSSCGVCTSRLLWTGQSGGSVWGWRATGSHCFFLPRSHWDSARFLHSHWSSASAARSLAPSWETSRAKW